MRHQFLQCYLRLESSEDLNIVEVGKGNFSIIEGEKVMMNDSNPLGIDVTTSDLDYLINLQGNEIYWYDMYIKQCVYMLCLLSHIGYRLYVQCTYMYVYMCMSKIILCTLIAHNACDVSCCLHVHAFIITFCLYFTQPKVGHSKRCDLQERKCYGYQTF